ncbi:MAG: 4Fe-4S dicluster domain-containing protein [Candidatus Latescibacteria bacterium]|nr:4Fe-4S dicluster domain-containing protein [Candidatus Latescibacterota bacterium]NIM66349.1 4Fe-4S dicluster domain-containing protein [Candidatus Latescibacterota bacterium]NIO02828.1 4Fe-4S dicluster domain-containing protein [Candidatus Latescibacterota bacterium]NIO29963.1 4Fe-4S dicluster domain-containing protein [Candidatus Latescibacterota bacterium]NIO57578.1 4Fe-4S dicluster domain-containing protein [Candidatus Latescibacterota bacterium]
MPKKNPVIEIKMEWCKGCAFCVEFCPKEVLQMKGIYPVVAKIEDCTACGLCEVLCPDFAIEVIAEDEAVKK